jgi:dipeptidyl aminopeptidase/acylaminoacyl peptidase
VKSSAAPQGPGRAPSVADAPAGSGATADDRFTPEAVTFPSGALTLHGFLYRPPGPGPFPAIVFNHGSEPQPGPERDQAAFYVPHGFVLFVPHRRGQGSSQDAGTYVDKAFDPAQPDSPAFTEALVAQNDDVMAAVTYVAALPYVDKRRVAMVGCTYGGIETLLAAERGTGLVSAVEFAAGTIMWKRTAPLRERLRAAVRNAKIPVLLLQAENDFDTTPTRELSEEMKRAGKPMRVHIFPTSDSSQLNGFTFCAGGEHPPWGDEVLAFLNDTMKPR